MRCHSGTYMLLIDIPFKGCQGRSNRSSIVHSVSYFAWGVNDTVCICACGVIDTPCIFNFFAYHRCFAYDFHFLKLFEKFVVHAVSMTPHACGINDTACIVH
jgi:hypothetical protein